MKSKKKCNARKSKPFTKQKGKSSIVIWEETKPLAEVKTVLNGRDPRGAA